MPFHYSAVEVVIGIKVVGLYGSCNFSNVNQNKKRGGFIMKRILVLSMIIIATLVFSCVGIAQTDAIPGNTPFTIDMTASVGKYAEIRMEETLLPHIEFVGNEYTSDKLHKQKSTGAPFSVSSNCPVNITVEGAPFTHVDNSDSVLQTRIDLRLEGNHIAHSGIDLGPRIGYPGAAWEPSTTLFLQGRGLIKYGVRVLAWLGDIHDLDAGFYMGEVTLTLSAAEEPAY